MKYCDSVGAIPVNIVRVKAGKIFGPLPCCLPILNFFGPSPAYFSPPPLTVCLSIHLTVNGPKVTKNHWLKIEQRAYH